MMKINKIIALPVILAWGVFFYLQFERPFLSALGQNLSPNFLPSIIRHEFFWLFWLAFPLLILSFFKGRFFCWYLCPVGLIQDLLPGFRSARIKTINTLLFLFLFGFGFFSLNLLAIFDPLVSVNRAVTALHTRALAAVVFLAPVLLILLLNTWRKRFWCFKLCPLGALFDWVTKLKTGFRSPERKQASDPGRRRALLTLGGGLAAGLAWHLFNRWRTGIHPRLIRPPGALPEDEFTDRCIRCGSCIGVCLTGGLQPSLLEGGPEGFFTPRLVPAAGESDEFCNKCGQACPTQAIRYLTLKQKRDFKMGTARINRDRCIAWSQDKHCLVCEEYCTYQAIRTEKNRNGIDCPVMIPDLCRGCGLCEKNCFATPFHAIIVFNEDAGRMIKSG